MHYVLFIPNQMCSKKTEYTMDQITNFSDREVLNLALFFVCCGFSALPLINRENLNKLIYNYFPELENVIKQTLASMNVMQL